MQNHFYVYILKCANDAYYIGHTDNIEQRLSEHHLGAIPNCYTKTRRPLELVFLQDFPTRDTAFHAERQIKGWSRSKKEAYMRSDWEKLKKLSISYNKQRALEDILRQAQDERSEN
ncbi:MAG TPA: GIY-YIG nuclease family protein [Candidatus Babeliales bacterium]|nr:GIY-YIG nuclease family protein [Candidatus Babeliales bacterium]